MLLLVPERSLLVLTEVRKGFIVSAKPHQRVPDVHVKAGLGLAIVVIEKLLRNKIVAHVAGVFRTPIHLGVDYPALILRQEESVLVPIEATGNLVDRGTPDPVTILDDPFTNLTHGAFTSGVMLVVVGHGDDISVRRNERLVLTPEHPRFNLPENIVRVDPEDVIPGTLLEREVPCSGEVTQPHMTLVDDGVGIHVVVDLRTKILCHLFRVVLRPSVGDDNLVNPRGDRLQGVR